MRLSRLVIKDILRRKRRVLYATLGVVVGTMTVVALLTVAGSGESAIYDQLEKYGANIAVVPAVRNLNMELGDISLGTVAIGENFIQEEKLSQIREIADGEIRSALGINEPGDIATIAPKLYAGADLRGTPVTIAGIDPQAEIKIKSWWTIQDGRYIEGEDEAALGAAAARALGLAPGDNLGLQKGSLSVVGVIAETGSSDDYLIFAPIGAVQKMFNKPGLVSSVDIRALCNACPAEVIAVAINRDIPGVRAVAVKQVAAAEMGMLDRVKQLMLALAGITVLVGGFGVANTMMTSVHQRMRDIGIMRAVGASRAQIIRLMVYEAVAIGIAGGMLGYGLGTLVARGIGPFIFEGVAVNQDVQYLPLALALAVCISVMATLYPASRATRIKVADSFRAM